MKHHSAPLLAAVMMCATHGTHAEGIFLSLGAGIGDINVDNTLFSNGEPLPLDDSDAAAVGELLVGYEFTNALFIEAGVQGYDSISFLGLGDILNLDVLRIGAGGYLPSESRWRFFGRTGLAFWDLEARESLLFNPGPEAEAGRDGTDLYVAAGIEFRFTESFRTGLSFEYANYGFGSFTAVLLTLKFVP